MGDDEDQETIEGRLKSVGEKKKIERWDGEEAEGGDGRTEPEERMDLFVVHRQPKLSPSYQCPDQGL